MFCLSQYRSLFRYKYYLTGFVVDTDCVHCEVRTETLYTIQLKLAFKWKKYLLLSRIELTKSYDLTNLANIFYYYMWY